MEINDLKATHDRLYQVALRDHAKLQVDQESREQILADVDVFLAEVERCARQVKSIEDYTWLTDAVLKWQVIFSSVLNLPRKINLLPAPEGLETTAETIFWTEEELKKWSQDRAYHQSLIRKAEFYLARAGLVLSSLHSSREEMVSDMRVTGSLFAARVLEGDIRFSRQLGPASYWRLESEWLVDVKRAKAYFTWLRRQNHSTVEQGNQEDYFAACEDLRQRLVMLEIKAPAEDFEDMRAYLEERYLTNGRFDPAKSAAHALLEAKARRVFEGTGRRDAEKNWSVAETYAHMFYDHIVPAVKEGHEESALFVLKAFQFNAQEDLNWIANCFEVALAIYFLPPAVVEKIWEASRDAAPVDSYTVSQVAISDLPRDWRVPKRLRPRLQFDRPRSLFVFRGVMTEAERDLLLDRLPDGRREDNGEAVRALFRQSRLLPRDSTL